MPHLPGLPRSIYINLSCTFLCSARLPYPARFLLCSSYMFPSVPIILHVPCYACSLLSCTSLLFPHVPTLNIMHLPTFQLTIATKFPCGNYLCKVYSPSSSSPLHLLIFLGEIIHISFIGVFEGQFLIFVSLLGTSWRIISFMCFLCKYFLPIFTLISGSVICI